MWFGRPGSLVQLPDPEPDIEGALGISFSATPLLGGTVVVQQGEQVSRTISLGWHWLTETQAALLTGYLASHRGRGPWVLITEMDRNKLDVNQSSGTEAWGTTEGFAASHGTLASSTAQSYLDSRSLLWTLPSSDPGDPFLSLPWAHSDYGFPVVANKSYAFSARVSADSASFVLTAGLRWYTASGVLISTSAWPVPALPGSLDDYVYAAVSGLAPPTAAYVLPAITAATMVNSGHVSLDQAQLEMNPAPSAWLPGMGSKRVAIQPFKRGYPLKNYHHLDSVVFVEVD